MTMDVSARLSIVLALLLPLYSTLTSANMVVDSAIIHFESGKSSHHDITVRNTGDQPLYIKVTPTLIKNPGTEKQQREKIINPKLGGLLVSPNKLVIAPGGRKRIRFVNLKPNRNTEGVYRVTIEPVTGKLVAQQTGIKILIGYEILVLAQPRGPNTNLIAQRNGKILTLTNSGNTNLFLFQGKQCPPDHTDIEKCKPLRDKRLYPGNQWEYSLPDDGPVHYQLSVANKNSMQSIP